jgi:hypothetical protein
LRARTVQHSIGGSHVVPIPQAISPASRTPPPLLLELLLLPAPLLELLPLPAPLLELLLLPPPPLLELLLLPAPLLELLLPAPLLLELLLLPAPLLLELLPRVVPPPLLELLLEPPPSGPELLSVPLQATKDPPRATAHEKIDTSRERFMGLPPCVCPAHLAKIAFPPLAHSLSPYFARTPLVNRSKRK